MCYVAYLFWLNDSWKYHWIYISIFIYIAWCVYVFLLVYNTLIATTSGIWIIKPSPLSKASTKHSFTSRPHIPTSSSTVRFYEYIFLCNIYIYVLCILVHPLYSSPTTTLYEKCRDFTFIIKKKSMQYRLDMEEWIFSCCRHVCVVRWRWWLVGWMSSRHKWNNNKEKLVASALVSHTQSHSHIVYM